MARMKKANKTVRVHDESVRGYLKMGYDEINDNGEIVQRAIAGRTVTLPAYNKLLDKVAVLEKDVETLKTELKRVRTENTKLKKEVEG